MCMSCGCQKPDDSHDNNDNMTYMDLVKACVAGGVSNVSIVLKNMCDTYEKICAVGSQSDEDAYADHDSANAQMARAPQSYDYMGTVPKA